MMFDVGRAVALHGQRLVFVFVVGDGKADAFDQLHIQWVHAVFSWSGAEGQGRPSLTGPGPS
jgi:hypothetical protein